MKIIISNVDFTQINNACYNALATSGIRGSLRMKLDAIIDSVKPKMESFKRAREVLIAEGGASIGDNNKLVWPDPAGEQSFEDFHDQTHVLDIAALTRPELARLITTDDRYGTADGHFQALKKVTDCFAAQPKQEKEPENKKEE